MFSNQVIRNCLIPTVAAAVVIERKGKPQDEETDCTTICRPSELPIYTSEPKKESITTKCPEEDPTLGSIENVLRNTRITYNKYYEDFQGYKKVGYEHFGKFRDNMDGVLKILQEEDNTMPKAGAIGIGALTGFVFGLRGGIIKRTLYATTGALSMAAVCYPHQATIYSRTGVEEAKKYFTIAYNFIYGVKKGDPPLELPSFPKIPSTFSEAWDSVKSTATSFVSEKEKLEVVEHHQVTIDTPDIPAVKDPLQIITDSHNTALHKSCHCPVGACLHSEENPSHSIQPADTSFIGNDNE